MLTIAICDDEPVFCRMLQERLRGLAQRMDADFSIDVYSDGLQIVQRSATLPTDYYAMVIFDIRMKEMGGIEAARQLRHRGWDNTKFIFISSYVDYFRELCFLEPTAFIEKRDLESRFDAVFLNVYQRLLDRKQLYYTVTENKATRSLRLAEIQYFESQNRKIAVHCANGQIIRINGSLAQICEDLKEAPFLLIQRSFLINFDFIARISSNTVELKNGKAYTFGRRYKESALAKYFAIAEGRRF